MHTLPTETPFADEVAPGEGGAEERGVVGTRNDQLLEALRRAELKAIIEASTARILGLALARVHEEGDPDAV